jgi:hypothetical protein
VNNLAFVSLLLFDIAPGCLQSVGGLFPPFNTITLLEPMDQAVTAAFKHYFAYQTVTREITAMGN